MEAHQPSPGANQHQASRPAADHATEVVSTACTGADADPASRQGGSESTTEPRLALDELADVGPSETTTGPSAFAAAGRDKSVGFRGLPPAFRGGHERKSKSCGPGWKICPSDERPGDEHGGTDLVQAAPRGVLGRTGGGQSRGWNLPAKLARRLDGSVPCGWVWIVLAVAAAAAVASAWVWAKALSESRALLEEVSRDCKRVWLDPFPCTSIPHLIRKDNIFPGRGIRSRGCFASA